MYRCRECFRECDVMIDGCHELNNGCEICDKCMYGEWQFDELRMLKDQQEVDACHYCDTGCEFCLMLEPRSMK